MSYDGVLAALGGRHFEGNSMRWIRYEEEGGARYGIVQGEVIAEVTGTPFGAHELTGKTRPLLDAKLALPCIPGTFYAVGQNYIVHAANYPGGQGTAASKVPTKPDVGYRAHSGLVAHGEAVVIPADSQSLQYEGELVVVIGKRGKRISKASAYDYVLGYTIGNDVSERSWQKADRTAWRAKNADTFSPMGPWIDTDADLSRMETIVRVNGRESTRFRTNDMLFGIDTFISAVSQYVTLQPGDMFWMGTEGTSPDLKDGDVVEVEITGIGTLRNPFVAQART
jgi:2-keto-4-pentenoate hydratase/2-oxohepta-3-ene-1,7-dioic acid hydratase in catechol pathway